MSSLSTLSVFNYNDDVHTDVLRRAIMPVSRETEATGVFVDAGVSTTTLMTCIFSHSSLPSLSLSLSPSVVLGHNGNGNILPPHFLFSLVR